MYILSLLGEVDLGLGELRWKMCKVGKKSGLITGRRGSSWLITSLSHIFDTLLPVLTRNVE